MRITFLILFCLCSSSVFCQKNTGTIQAEYRMFCDTDVPLKFTTILWVKDNTAIYQEKTSTTERWEEKPLAESLKDQSVNFSSLKSDFEPYFKTDLSKKELLFYAPLLKNTAFVKDTYDINWNITGDTKKIAGYNCIKATTVFRGREWVAWFAPDIALPFGPWKFHGLPGLILEVYDITNRYTYKLEKIGNLENAAIFQKDFSTLMPALNKEPMPYRKYLDDKEEAMVNALRSIDQKLNVVTTKKKIDPNNREEIKYEWE
ncbi:GLPGLI family protein [Flavobacterium sp. DGU11]|uniref:GLPGLI family protein n=1 Tax=Flavobacterium arundinis TaxID=3139143 RepID=A0ABU9HX18_9FLAO